MDIARIFKARTRRELFRLYFTNPDNGYYLRELERILDIPVSMIRKELTRLGQDGIFTVSAKGNLTYFHLNKSYPLFDELKSIVFKTIGIKGSLKKLLEGLQGITTAFIYGSFAKDEANAQSDIDLLVIGQVDEHKLIQIIRKSEKALKREINYSLYTKKDWQKKLKEKNAFIQDLITDPKIFLIGDKNDL